MTKTSAKYSRDDWERSRNTSFWRFYSTNYCKWRYNCRGWERNWWRNCKGKVLLTDLYFTFCNEVMLPMPEHDQKKNKQERSIRINKLNLMFDFLLNHFPEYVLSDHSSWHKKQARALLLGEWLTFFSLWKNILFNARNCTKPSLD